MNEEKSSVEKVEQVENLNVEAGIHFVKDYPNEIYPVEDHNIFIDKYLPEIEWAWKYLFTRNGYAVSLPQIGVPYNAAVIRFSRGSAPIIVTNVSFEPFQGHGKRFNIEFDFSVNQGKKALKISRWNKIKAKYEVITFDKDKKAKVVKVEKVMRNPAKSFTPPDGAIIQNIVEHMNPKYMEKYRD